MTIPARDRYRIEDLPERIRSKIWVNPRTGCWEHQGSRNGHGYVQISWDGRLVVVHRLVYTLLVGSISEGLTLDHVRAWGCRSKACCWPGHLEPVTQAENNQRRGEVRSAKAEQTRCVRGHEFDAFNTYIDSLGRRCCRACGRIRKQGYRRQRAAAEGREIGPPMKSRTHCPHGHEYTPENTYLQPRRAGGCTRVCRACKRERGSTPRRAA